MRNWIRHFWAITCKRVCHPASVLLQVLHSNMGPGIDWMRQVIAPSAQWDQSASRHCLMVNGTKLEATQLRNIIRKCFTLADFQLDLIPNLPSTVVSSLVHMTIVSTIVACWTPTVNPSPRRSTKCTANASPMSQSCLRHHCIHTPPLAPTCHQSPMCHWSMNPTSHMQSHRITWKERHRHRRSSNHQRQWWTRKWNILTQLTFHTIVTWRAEAPTDSRRTNWLITITHTRCHTRGRWTATEPRQDRKPATRRSGRARMNTWLEMKSALEHCKFRLQ